MDCRALRIILVLAFVSRPVKGQDSNKQQSDGKEEVTLITEEKWLQFLPGSTWRVGVLLNTPLDDPFYNVYKGLLFRWDYILPSFNDSTLRTKRGATGGARWTLYSMTEEALDRAGVPGRACLLRAVCEASAAPLHQDGLMGQLLHLLLTPSSSGEHSTLTWHKLYQRAERWGAQNEDCSLRYTQTCPYGALEHFTTLFSTYHSTLKEDPSTE